MRINYIEGIRRILLIVLIIALYKFFFLFDRESFTGSGVYGSSLITVLLLSICNIFFNIIGKIRVKIPIFTGPIIIIEMMMIIVVIATQDVGAFSRIGWCLTLLMLYLALVFSIKNENDLDFVFFSFQLCTIIVCALLIIQAIVVNLGGNFFLHIHFIESNSWYTFRNDRLRILENENLYLIGYIISLVNLRCNHSKMRRLISIICIGLSLVYNVYVSQTRMILFSEVMLLVIMYFYKSKLSVKRLVLAVIIIPLAIEGISLIQDYLMNSLVLFVSDKSVTIRLLEYTFFLNAGLEFFPFGVGFRDISMNYYAGDVGVIGIIGKYGYIVASLVLYIYIKMFRTMKNEIIKNNDGQKLMLYLIMFNTLFLLILANPLEDGHIHVFAIEMAMVELMSMISIHSIQKANIQNKHISIKKHLNKEDIRRQSFESVW